MKFDGKTLAETILTTLKREVSEHAKDFGVPTLAVILVGDDPASLAYIRQKQKAAERIGATIQFDHLPGTTTPEALHDKIRAYNTDTHIHGLIIQRPVPIHSQQMTGILESVERDKDIDGFLPDSPFIVPVAAAVGEILISIHTHIQPDEKNFWTWLRHQRIAVIGRGDTAGAPIDRYLRRNDCTTSVVHTSTPNPMDTLKQSDIIISCVGKEGIVPREAVKPGAILISVGLWRDLQGKLRGDYNEKDISDIASWYTPTPGGVGPVNVACLMQNLLKACKMKQGGKL